MATAAVATAAVGPEAWGRERSDSTGSRVPCRIPRRRCALRLGTRPRVKRGTWSSPETPDETDALGGDGPETSAPPVDLDSPDASDEPLDPPPGPFAPDREDGMPRMPPSDIHLQAPGKWSPIAYAFLGDAVWELYVRRLFFAPPARPLEYDLKCKRAVRAEAQDAVLRTLLANEFFTPEETKIVKWGRNASYGNVPTRLRGKNKSKNKNGGGFATYRNASALECVVGYLYMTDLPRLEEMMAGLGVVIERVARENDTR